MTYDSHNIFARILRGEIPCQKIIETSHSVAFYDIHPQASPHILLIPKKPYIHASHFFSQASAEEITDFFQTTAQLVHQFGLENGCQMRIHQGPKGGQEIYHFHLHLLGASLGGHTL